VSFSGTFEDYMCCS